MTPTDPDAVPAPAAAPTTTAPAAGPTPPVARAPRPPPEETRPALSVSERAARRRRRRTVVFWIVALAAVALALMLIRCGGGFGLGDGSGLGGGAGQGPGARGALSAPARCQLRVDAVGISLAGKPVSIDAAVAACLVASGAEIVVTGDARQGTWDALRARLDAAGIASLVHLAGAPGRDAGTGAP